MVRPTLAFDDTACDPFLSTSACSPGPSLSSRQTALLSVCVVGCSAMVRCPSRAINAPVATRPSAATAHTPVMTPLLIVGLAAIRKPTNQMIPQEITNTTGPPLLLIHNMIRENE